MKTIIIPNWEADILTDKDVYKHDIVQRSMHSYINMDDNIWKPG